MLHALLREHPDIVAGSGDAPEDFLLANANHLVDFVEATRESWATLRPKDGPGSGEMLLRSTWRGVEEHLLTSLGCDDSQPANANLYIARTPSVVNLDVLDRLTDTKAVVIVRDGRAVLESGMRSFGWSFEEYLHRWADAAARIHQVTAGNDQMLVVRYEDLLADKTAELHRIFAFLDVDASRYPFDVEVPVYGSSEQIDRGQYWEGHAAPAGFDPLTRWHHWGRNRSRRFDDVAGDGMRAFGYLADSDGSAPSFAYNRLMDLAWPIRRVARTIAREVLPRETRNKILWKRGEIYRKAVRSLDGSDPS